MIMINDVKSTPINYWNTKSKKIDIYIFSQYTDFFDCIYNIYKSNKSQKFFFIFFIYFAKI